ncbi:hypothetical protein [Acinetobacter bereziniae]|uniref:hypothetical protein n=1 Tax=Acinetobacter bereziniae TaxID=106648 RepID=UPI00124E5E08|nr:hypothetical protein [Acinetobacter bereziniae]
MNKYVSYIVLNTQLLIGFIFSYNFIDRALIKENFSLFLLLVFICSNILFFMGNFIKYFSVKAFLSIFISSFFITLIVLKFNKPEMELRPIDYALVMGYLIVILKLYITTPIVLIIEILLKKKYKF